MIGWLKGRVVELSDDEVIIDAGNGGVGYRVFLASRDLDAMTRDSIVEVFIYTQVREDAISLYGFMHRDERMLFTKLVTVTGVGAKLGLAILNAMSPTELQRAILSKDAAALKRIPGIGLKMAGRLILELESTMSSITWIDQASSTALPFAKTSKSHSDTRSALANLGFNEAVIDDVLNELDEAGEEMRIEDEILWALARIKKR